MRAAVDGLDRVDEADERVGERVGAPLERDLDADARAADVVDARVERARVQRALVPVEPAHVLLEAAGEVEGLPSVRVERGGRDGERRK